ncbi:MAG: condensation domain-containing protein, partial [Bacteroidota bacterium]
MNPSSTSHLSLTRSQTWVWAGQQLLPDGPMNNMAFAFHLREKVDQELFRQAFQRLLVECDALHARLEEKEEAATMFFEPAVVDRLGLSSLSVAPEALEEWLTKETAKPFDLTQRLFRSALLQVKADHFVWYFNQHHLITDGWSYSLQVQFVLQTYVALREGKVLPEANFGSFASYLAHPPQPAPEARTYWDERARQLPSPPRLFGRGNPERSSHASRQIIQLTEEQAVRLAALCQEPEVRNWSADLTRFTVFATAFFAYLYRISGQAGLTIGVPAHNRVSRTDKQTPGMFMELFPQSVTIEPGETFASLLQKVKAESLHYLRHAKPGSSTRAMNQTFSSLLNYITRAFVGEEKLNLTSEWLHSGHSEPGHHLNLQVYDFDATGRATLCFDVNETVLEPELHSLVPGQFLEVLETMLTDRTLPLNPLCTRVLASKNAPGSIGQLQQFNTQADYPAAQTVVDLFYRSAAKNATKTAVVAEDKALTFAELDQR